MILCVVTKEKVLACSSKMLNGRHANVRQSSQNIRDLAHVLSGACEESEFQRKTRGVAGALALATEQRLASLGYHTFDALQRPLEHF